MIQQSSRADDGRSCGRLPNLFVVHNSETITNTQILLEKKGDCIMKPHRYRFLAGIFMIVAFLFSGPALAEDIDAKLSDTADASSFQVKNSSDSVLMKVQSGGDVGIGTTSPKEKFQIGDRLTIHDGGWKIISNNSYWWVDPADPNEGNDKRIVEGYAAAMAFTDIGDILFRTAGTGSAGDILDDGTYSTWDTPPLIVKNDGKIGIGTDAPNSSLNVEGSFSVKRTGVSSHYTSSGETIIGVTSVPTAGLTVTLASADCVEGRIIYIKDESGQAGHITGQHITVNTEGAETIDGESSITLYNPYEYMKAYSNGTNWFLVGSPPGQ